MHRASLASFALLAAVFAGIPAGGCTNGAIIAYYEEPDSSVVLETPQEAGTTPVGPCGNGRLDDGEGCDDGNTKSGDGCSATCTVEELGSSCPGTAIALTQSTGRFVGKVTGNTTGSIASLQSNTCGGGSGPDLVYTLTPTITGAARVKLTAQFDAILGARTACASAASEIACKTTPVNGGVTELTFGVTANQTVALVVDGVGGKSGTFTLDVDVAPSVCGDGIAQFPEQCDDGNVASNDGCSSSCALEGGIAAPGKCPGASYTITGPSKKVSFAGDISQLANTMGAFGCGDASGKDQVYAITPTTSGSITAELTGQYADAIIHVRGECFTSSTEVDCKEQPLASVPVKTTFPVTANTTYFVFVDTDTDVSKGPANGLYTLDVTLSPAACQNGILETPEECDDGNADANDGCSPTCTLEAAPAGLDSCPGAAIAWSGDPAGPLSFKTTASTVPLTANVVSCGNTTRKDAVYSFTAPFNGWITAKTKSSFNVELSVRRDCVAGDTSSTSNQVACSDASGGDGDEIVQGAVNAGTTYYVVVEGGFSNTNKEGVFSLDLELKPAVCGNGVIEGGETCDDGALATGDGCNASCQIEPTPTTGTSCTNTTDTALTEVAPGVFTASASGGNWHMPNAAAFTAPCAAAGKEAFYSFTAPINGVATVRADATYNVSIGARSPCAQTGTGFLTCSNRAPAGGSERMAFVVTQGTRYFVIVDATGTNERGSYSMQLAIQAESCGDGIVSGAEACDDGNTTAGDGCSATCTLEPLAGLDTCPGHAVALAGVGTQPRQKVVSFSNSSLLSHYAGTCGGSGRDGVVAVTSDIPGTMIAQLKTAWPAAFYARTTCTDGGTELDCEESNPASPHLDTRELSFPVVPGTPVYLFVDSLGQTTGPATLFLTVTP